MDLDEDQTNELLARGEIHDRIGVLKSQFAELGVEPPERNEAVWTLGEYEHVLRNQLRDMAHAST